MQLRSFKESQTPLLLSSYGKIRGVSRCLPRIKANAERKKKVLGKPRSCVVFWEVFGDDMRWRQVWALKYGLSKLHEHNPWKGKYQVSFTLHLKIEWGRRKRRKQTHEKIAVEEWPQEEKKQ